MLTILPKDVLPVLQRHIILSYPLSKVYYYKSSNQFKMNENSCIRLYRDKVYIYLKVAIDNCYCDISLSYPTLQMHILDMPKQTQMLNELLYAVEDTLHEIVENYSI